jgi:hypothetical protein
MVLEAAAPSAAASTEPRDAPQTSLGTPSKWRRTDIWRDEVADVTGGPIDYGHYVRQETLNLTLQWFVRHFGP